MTIWRVSVSGKECTSGIERMMSAIKVYTQGNRNIRIYFILLKRIIQ